MAIVSYTPRPDSQESVFDMGRLSDLKRGVVGTPTDKAEQKKVAKQFEALFLQMMIKRMRAATPKDGLFDSQATEMIQSMTDEQLALQLADPGIGLAKSLLDQMPKGRSPDGQGQDEAGDGRQAGLDLRRRQGGEVSALLDVLRTNRPGDRVMAAAEGAPDHVVDFVSRMSHAANAASQQSGVPARLILGQAALESGWGKREIMHADGRTSHNVFGIKAGSSWTGKVVNVTTTEYVDGVPQKMVQPFRAYGSYEEAFADYARLIGDSPRYEAVTQARNEIEAARSIQKAGYATDPAYADKLIQIMGQLSASISPATFSGRR
ncbi:peptidoglycan hydrolase [Bordetella ansorpii]|uniref:Peptidoglycan hydrolase FlgJ n=1 Tax=Bordetella ansorpii TaxID=288768 RepID=A0A157SLA0_9BORD|nr:flagellar assembly peptidoglycan hydrolase FlgJ [Bordetella ansorpii]SAI71250.1 peptidoglycan hydrolase [Bordetella ansorpii]